MRSGDGDDVSTVAWARVMAASFTPTTKSQQIETQGLSIDGVPGASNGLSDVGTCWAIVAPPAPPTSQDGDAAEALVSQIGDQVCVMGTRDVRCAKNGADLAPGDSAFINFYGQRLFLKKSQSGLSAYGGILLFQKAVAATKTSAAIDATVSIIGIPANPGTPGTPAVAATATSPAIPAVPGTPAGPATYMNFTTTGWTVVSASGGAFFSVDDTAAVMQGSAGHVNCGNVFLGLTAAAVDPVVTVSYLQAAFAELIAVFSAHVHNVIAPTPGTPGSPPLTPLLLLAQGSKTVKATP